MSDSISIRRKRSRRRRPSRSPPPNNTVSRRMRMGSTTTRKTMTMTMTMTMILVLLVQSLFISVATAKLNPSLYLCQLPGQTADCTECERVCEDTCLEKYLECGPALTTCQGIKGDCDDDCQVEHRYCELVTGLPAQIEAPEDISSFSSLTCPVLEIANACTGTDFEGLFTGSYIPVEPPATCNGSSGQGVDAFGGEDLASVLSGETPLYRHWYPDSLDETQEQFRYTYLYRTGNVRWGFKRNVISICDPPIPDNADNSLTGTGHFVASQMQPHLDTAGSVLCRGNAVNGQVFVEETSLELCCLSSGEGNACEGTSDGGLLSPPSAPSAGGGTPSTMITPMPSSGGGGAATPTNPPVTSAGSSSRSSFWWCSVASLLAVIALPR